MADDKNTKKDLEKAFDIDGESTSSVPSITRLLNRKKLGLKPAAKDPPVETVPETKIEPKVEIPQPPVEVAEIPPETPIPQETPIAVLTPVPPAQDPPTQIQKSTRPPMPPQEPLLVWEPRALKKGSDPLGKGITLLLTQGAKQVLFLSIKVVASSPVPHFVSAAAVNIGDKGQLWTGLNWDPRIVPELWNTLLKTGYAELPPAGTQTNLQSNRNVMRSALGITKQEWLLLIRVGSAASCRGIIAVTSEKSIAEHLTKALPDLHAAPKS